MPKQNKKNYKMRSPRVSKKHPKPTIDPATISERTPHGWMVVGFDVSFSSMAGAAFGYDRTLNLQRGPAFTARRWTTEDHYFDRLEMAAKSYELVLDLIAELGMVLAEDEIWIAQEEPFPPHTKFMGKGQSSFLKQQAEISGAFLGGLLRYGYRQIFQIHNASWRKVVADQLTEDGKGIVSTHHSKWKSPELALRFNCKPENSGKFRAQQWAHDVLEPAVFQQHRGTIPDWPGIIETKHGKAPKPETSKAKPIQCDDRYEALAMAEWMRLEIWDDLQRMMR